MRNTITLAAIVYNEENFILPLLESVYQYIDFYCIVDGHSTDRTVEIIESFFQEKGIPGNVHQYSEQPFRGDHKRTMAIDLAKNKTDYILFLDADNTLDILHDGNIINETEGYPFANLDKDAYLLTKKSGDIEYPVLLLFRRYMDWHFQGIIHDFPGLRDGSTFTEALLPGVIIHEPVKHEGPRKKGPENYYRDALIIERELLDNGTIIPPMLRNRYLFYLAQSWHDANFMDRALDAYDVRIKMGGWYEEIYYSNYMIGYIMLQRHHKPISDVAVYFHRALEVSPGRREAAYQLMQIYLCQQMPKMAVLIGSYCNAIPCNDTLFINNDIRDRSFPELLASWEKII